MWYTTLQKGSSSTKPINKLHWSVWSHLKALPLGGMLNAANCIMWQTGENSRQFLNFCPEKILHKGQYFLQFYIRQIQELQRRELVFFSRFLNVSWPDASLQSTLGMYKPPSKMHQQKRKRKLVLSHLRRRKGSQEVLKALQVLWGEAIKGSCNMMKGERGNDITQTKIIIILITRINNSVPHKAIKNSDADLPQLQTWSNLLFTIFVLLSVSCSSFIHHIIKVL